MTIRWHGNPQKTNRNNRIYENVINESEENFSESHFTWGHTACVAHHGSFGVPVKQHLDEFLENAILSQHLEFSHKVHHTNDFMSCERLHGSCGAPVSPYLGNFREKLRDSDSILRIFSSRKLHKGPHSPSHATRLVWLGVAPHLTPNGGVSSSSHPTTPPHNPCGVTRPVWGASVKIKVKHCLTGGHTSRVTSHWPCDPPLRRHLVPT